MNAQHMGQFVVAAILAMGGLNDTTAAEAPDPAARIVANWLTEPKDGIVQIRRTSEGLYEGRIVGGNQPDRLDANNPDASRRHTLLLGQLILRALHYDGDGKWSGGSIYDPDSGRTYKCQMQLISDGTLKVRGFIGIALLGKSQIWSRYLGNSMDLSH